MTACVNPNGGRLRVRMIHKEKRRVISSSLVYQSNAKITAVALSSPTRAFFGMDDGLLEECEIVPSSTRSDESGSLPLVASVVGRKPLWISKVCVVKDKKVYVVVQ